MDLDNYTEIAQNKLIILYLLSRQEVMIQKTRIVYIMLECSLMNYFTLLETIDELIGDKMITQKNTVGGAVLGISAKGIKTASHFFESIPKGIRKRVNEQIKLIREKEEFDEMVTAKAVETDIDVFEAQLWLRERDIDLMNLKILAGSKDEALRICKKFKENHEEAYRHIISYFLK